MDLIELTKAFRVDAQDQVEPHIFADESVWAWLAEAEQEAAIRGRLIHESENPQVCEIPLIEGTAIYRLHWALYEIDHLAFVSGDWVERQRIQLVSRVWLDANYPSWRDDSGIPEYAVQEDTTIRFSPKPHAPAGRVIIEGYRLPMRGLKPGDKTSEPEIHRAHHRNLVDWALYRAFRLPDSDAMNLGKSDEAEMRFTKYFGLRTDSDLRRITRHDVPHHVDAFMP